MAHQVLNFPSFASALGGARFVRYSARFAWITTAANATIRVKRSTLPANPEQWSAFTLADAAHNATTEK